MRMKNVCKILAVGLVAGLVSSAAADVINFDDLVGQAPVPNGYGTVVDWTGWTYYDWEQSPYNPNSPPVRIYNTSNGTFKFGRDVVFDGAFFSGYGTNRGFLPISFQLYSNNVLVATSGSIDLGDGSGPTWLDSGYAGAIDTVVVVGSHGFYVMDDVTFNEAVGYRLSVSGECPGVLTLNWRGATPNRTQGIVFGASQGNTTIPSGVCQGTVLGIQGQVRLVNTIGTGATGEGSVSGPAGTAACGHFLQLVEAPSCLVSNVAGIQ